MWSIILCVIISIAAVDGQGFVAMDVTFCNTTGPSKDQVVSVRNGLNYPHFVAVILKVIKTHYIPILKGNFIKNVITMVQ